MRKGITIAVVAVLISSFMVTSVGADTPTASKTTSFGVVLKGEQTEEYTISGGRPVGKSFDIGTTTNALSEETSNATSIFLDWSTAVQSEVDTAYTVYGTHGCTQYGQYDIVYTTLDF